METIRRSVGIGGARQGSRTFATDSRRLLGVLQEPEHAISEQFRRALVVDGEVAVREEVPIAGVEEQLRLLNRLLAVEKVP